MLANLTGSARARLAQLETPEKLVPIAICALVVAAALVSALPPAGAASANGPASEYGMGMAGLGSQDNVDPGQLDPGQLDPGLTNSQASYPPQLAIVNIPQNAAQTAQPMRGFTSYIVKNGDSLNSIASRNGIKIETLYYANKKSLRDPTAIKAGLKLLIPPTDGVVVVVADGDTLMGIANKYQVTAVSIIDANGLVGSDVVTGQTLIVPGVDPGQLPGAPGAGGGTKYTGGTMWWPVDGPWHISQGYWSGHHAIDIAAPYGTPVVAAAGGTVVIAGWLSTAEGGNVVWINHGNGVYTTYNHLSKWYVHSGQTVRAGEKIGLIGTSGVSTGPHLHFEVWLTYPWANGTNSEAVNPCYYLAQC